MLMLVSLPAVSAKGEKEEQMQRINYGVTFYKESNIVFGMEYWYHTFEIPLPSKVVVPVFPQCDIVHQNCYILNQVITQLSALKTEVAVNINATVDVLHRILPKTNILSDIPIQSRTKRGLFDFVGSISRGLFGTATVEDVQKLARHVNILMNRDSKLAKAMTHHDEMLSSFMTKSDERFENMNAVEMNLETIVNITSETAKFIAHFKDISLQLSNILISHMNQSSAIYKYLQNLKVGIDEITKGQLSPFLLSPKILHKVIRHIQIMLSEKFKGFYLLHTDVSYYFSKAQLLYARKHDTLYVTLKFPVSTFSSPLLLYAVNSYPVPVNASSNHGTQILDLPTHFVVTANKQYYASISYKQLHSCVGSNTLY